MNPLTGGYAGGLSGSHSLVEIAGGRIPNRKCEGYETMNRNTDLGYHGRRNLSTISVRRLPGRRVTHWHIPGRFGDFSHPGPG